MSAQPVPIFVSMGQIFTPQQRAFADALFAALRVAGMAPEHFLREPPSEEPWLKAIQEHMQQCHGALVVAFPRVRYEQGVEWPDSARQTPLASRSLATIWLQVEATMAFTLDLPLLILIERDLHAEGLVNLRHREVYPVEYDLRELRSRAELPANVRAALDDFVARALRHAGRQI